MKNYSIEIEGTNYFKAPAIKALINLRDALMITNNDDQAMTVINIINAKCLLFYINEDESSRRKICCNNTSILNGLSLHIDKFRHAKEIFDNSRPHKLSPYVDLLTKNLTARLADEIAPYFDFGPSFSCTYDHDGFIKTPYLLNKIVNGIRTDAASPESQLAPNKYLMNSDVNNELDANGRTNATVHEAK